jgi:hypothetical protein
MTPRTRAGPPLTAAAAPIRTTPSDLSAGPTRSHPYRAPPGIRTCARLDCWRQQRTVTALPAGHRCTLKVSYSLEHRSTSRCPSASPAPDGPRSGVGPVGYAPTPPLERAAGGHLANPDRLTSGLRRSTTGAATKLQPTRPVLNCAQPHPTASYRPRSLEQTVDNISCPRTPCSSFAPVSVHTP